MQEIRVHTLVRGPRAEDHVSDEKLRSILDDNLTTNDEKMALLWRTIDTTRFGDFTDQAFSVSVTKPVGLTSLGFYGPYEKNQAEYRLKFKIYEMVSMTPRVSRRVLESLDRKIEAYKDKLFYVNFSTPVICPKKTWIRIEFMLNGPVTRVCRKIYSDYKQPDNVIFDFYNSSKQIPEIKYVLL